VLLLAQEQDGGAHVLQPRRPGGHDHPLLRGALCDNGHLVHRPLHHALRLPLQEGSQPPPQSAAVPKAAHRESQVSDECARGFGVPKFLLETKYCGLIPYANKGIINLFFYCFYAMRESTGHPHIEDITPTRVKI